MEILWPGGRVDRIEGVEAGERIIFPEIPCDSSLNRKKYRSCVGGALKGLRERGVISKSLADRFKASALRARTGSERRAADGVR